MRRSLEDLWLYTLMVLLLTAGLLFLGIVVLLEAQPAAPLVEAEPVVAESVPTPTPEPTFTPLPAGKPTPLSSLTPEPTSTATPRPSPTRLRGTYRVQPNDTLLGIALRAGVTLDQILLANLNIKDPNKLQLGQIINIPVEGQMPSVEVVATPTPLPLIRLSGSLNYPNLGSPGGYVPDGAMSVSDAHTVGRKQYPAGTFEYLHGQLKLPFPLPYVDKTSIKLPPPLPPGQCPLTGLPLANANVLNRRPLNARVDNSPPARPQSGLSSADIIFETLAEGGITRFTAVFYCEPRDVDLGPIRSARLIDLQLAPMFKAILVHVGASAQVTDMIWSSEIGEADFDPVFRGVPGFGRIPQRPAPHNMYTSIGTLWDVAARRGLGGPVDLQGLSFGGETPRNGRAANRVYVPYSGVNDVSYVYSEANGRYTKLIGGALHVDANTGQALTFANVIVLFAPALYTEVLEDGVASRSLYFRVQGEGRALLMRDGQAFEAIWHHEGRNILFHYTDAAGNHIPLKPGQTMVNIVPGEMRVSVE